MHKEIPMKRLIPLIFLTVANFLTGCAPLYDSTLYDNDYPGRRIDAILTPDDDVGGNTDARTGLPRKYEVTPQEEAKYQELNDEVTQRKGQLSSNHDSPSNKDKKSQQVKEAFNEAKKEQGRFVD
jgi:hypothetical protein